MEGLYSKQFRFRSTVGETSSSDGVTSENKESTPLASPLHFKLGCLLYRWFEQQHSNAGKAWGRESFIFPYLGKTFEDTL